MEEVSGFENSAARRSGVITPREPFVPEQLVNVQ